MTAYLQGIEGRVFSKTAFPIPGAAFWARVLLRLRVRKGDRVALYMPMVPELVKQIRRVIGPIATPEAIHLVSSLPKTRSGKIMRRILKKIAAGDSNLGDTSILADPAVLEEIREAVRSGRG